MWRLQMRNDNIRLTFLIHNRRVTPSRLQPTTTGLTARAFKRELPHETRWCRAERGERGRKSEQHFALRPVRLSRSPFQHQRPLPPYHGIYVWHTHGWRKFTTNFGICLFPQPECLIHSFYPQGPMNRYSFRTIEGRGAWFFTFFSNLS